MTHQEEFEAELRRICDEHEAAQLRIDRQCFWMKVAAVAIGILSITFDIIWVWFHRP